VAKKRRSVGASRSRSGPVVPQAHGGALRPFVRGESGNPGGRPRHGVISVALRELLAGGDVDLSTPAGRLAAKLAEWAEKDLKALKELLGRSEGRWPRDVDRDARLQQLTDDAIVATFGMIPRADYRDCFLHDSRWRDAFREGWFARERLCGSGRCRFSRVLSSPEPVDGSEPTAADFSRAEAEERALDARRKERVRWSVLDEGGGSGNEAGG